MAAPRGFSLLEALVVVGLVGAAVAVTLPAAARLRSAARTGAGARIVASRLVRERSRAVAGRRTHGLFFERDARGWTWTEVLDGNGNGLRTREVRSGVDPRLGGRRRLEDDVAGVRVGIPPGGPYPEAPPGTDLLSEGDDPVRFGVSDLVSFSPLGNSSSGTIYVTDGTDLRAVVVFGPTVRTRVWRWSRTEGRWKL